MCGAGALAREKPGNAGVRGAANASDLIPPDLPHYLVALPHAREARAYS